MTDADDLLRRVHERIGGGLVVDIEAEPGRVEVKWARNYGEELSDWRWAERDSLTAALQAVLDYEDWADRKDAEEESDG